MNTQPMSINRYKTRKDLIVEVLNRKINIRLHLNYVYTIDENHEWTNECAVKRILEDSYGSNSDSDNGFNCGSDCGSDCEYKCDPESTNTNVLAFPRCKSAYIVDTTTSYVDVPNDDIDIEINIDMSDLKEDIIQHNTSDITRGNIQNRLIQYNTSPIWFTNE
jgi:hypothetical protein